MSDLISRQAAIDAIIGQPPEPHYPTWYAEQIKALPSAEPEPHWIPCDERLPEPRTDVWCNSDLGQMPGFYDETTGTWYRGDYLELLVNAWMPLPSPYQPEEESE